MFIFGANPHRASSGLDIVGHQFVLGSNLYRAYTGLDIDGRQFVFGAGLELGADSEKFVENLEYFPNTMLF